MHCRNFVEIYPVKQTADGFEPVYDDKVRGSSSFVINGPGDLSLVENPRHVPGAYENLQHYQLRSDLEERGMRCAVGETHRVQITPKVAREMQFYELSDRGRSTYGSRLSGLLGAAARAGQLAGATHVEIKIS